MDLRVRTPPAHRQRRNSETMITGVQKVICTCGQDMTKTGGIFGGMSPEQDTYYCQLCQKHVVVVTPKDKEQKEFTQWEQWEQLSEEL